MSHEDEGGVFHGHGKLFWRQGKMVLPADLEEQFKFFVELV